MATLTYDPTPADQPEFNEAEQEALAIGEQAEAEQNQMLAGKFKDAEALEKAYLELQSKLGESNENGNAEEGVREQEQAPEEEVEPSIADVLNEANQQYAENGELSPEMIEKLSAMDSKELVDSYMQLQAQEQVQDLTESQVNEVFKSVGGEEAYQGLMAWAGENLPQNFVESYDNLVNIGDPSMIKLALAGLRAAYIDSNGYEGQMLSGKASRETADVFRSQAEVVQAMNDPRYDRDPAYRNDVFEKLNRSNIDY
jgi:hypothetical protein